MTDDFFESLDTLRSLRAARAVDLQETQAMQYRLLEIGAETKYLSERIAGDLYVALTTNPVEQPVVKKTISLLRRARHAVAEALADPQQPEQERAFVPPADAFQEPAGRVTTLTKIQWLEEQLSQLKKEMEASTAAAAAGAAASCSAAPLSPVAEQPHAEEDSAQQEEEQTPRQQPQEPVRGPPPGLADLLSALSAAAEEPVPSPAKLPVEAPHPIPVDSTPRRPSMAELVAAGRGVTLKPVSERKLPAAPATPANAGVTTPLSTALQEALQHKFRHAHALRDADDQSDHSGSDSDSDSEVEDTPAKAKVAPAAPVSTPTPAAPAPAPARANLLSAISSFNKQSLKAAAPAAEKPKPAPVAAQSPGGGMNLAALQAVRLRKTNKSDGNKEN